MSVRNVLDIEESNLKSWTLPYWNIYNAVLGGQVVVGKFNSYSTSTPELFYVQQ